MSGNVDHDAVTVSVGDPASAAIDRLGSPEVDKPLKNDAPATMGASVIEYVFTDDVVTLVRGTERRQVRAVQFILDPDARILRIVENPNAYAGSAPRLQRGSTVLADKAVLPTDPALRAGRR